MKKLLFIATVLVLGTTSAFAQFTNTGSTSSNRGGGAYETQRSLKISYMPAKIKGDGGGDISLNGATVELVNRQGISQDAPLYAEFGVGASWVGGEIEDTDLKVNYFSLQVPLYLGYQYNVSDKVAVSPYAGIYLRGNIFGNYKIGGESYNAFDKDEVGDLKLNRFNIGWRIGVNFDFEKVYIGASYGSDFNDIIDHGKEQLPQITVGFNF